MARVVGMAEAAGAEVRHWLILVWVYLLGKVSRDLEQRLLHRLGHWEQWILLELMEPTTSEKGTHQSVPFF
jgi:hypothetical protein